MIKHTLFAISLIVIFFFMSACFSRQDIYISDTGEGAVSIDINLDNMLTSYAGDLLGGFSGPDQKNVQLFDIQKIKNTVMGLEGVFLTEISSSNSESLHLNFSFKNPADIFKNPLDTGIPDLVLTALLGLKDSEVLDTFGPQENPYTNDEYLDLMDYMFEEYETSANIRTIVRTSKIIINLKTDGQIVLNKGCKVLDSGSTAIIEIPLLDIVTLEKPIEVFVEWE